jgi:hypothetical protein
VDKIFHQEWICALHESQLPTRGSYMTFNPEGIRRAPAAFIRDSPALIANRGIRGKYVCYHDEECVVVNSDYLAIIKEITREAFREMLH